IRRRPLRYRPVADNVEGDENWDTMSGNADWPALPLAEWKDTYATLHLWTQVIGKVALAQAPPLNHSWGVALHLSPRGLITPLLPHGPRSLTIQFDFVDHQLITRTTDGHIRTIALQPQSVAAFYSQVMTLLAEMSLPVKIWPVSVEMPTAVRLDHDLAHDAYDANAVTRFWRALRAIASVLAETRCSFVGKASPVHFFWGGFDLAVTRFSGRPAPPREGPAFMREAYSHEVVSHGFWPRKRPEAETGVLRRRRPHPSRIRHRRGRTRRRVLPHGTGRISAALQRDAIDPRSRSGPARVHQQHLHTGRAAGRMGSRRAGTASSLVGADPRLS